MKKLILLSTTLLFLSIIIQAQDKKTANIKMKTNSEKIYSPQATGDAIKFKDDIGNVLIQVEDEGSAGSIVFPSITPGSDGKLYNQGGDLYWAGYRLGLEYFDVSELNDLSDAKYDGSSLFLGEGAGKSDDRTTNWNTAVGLEALFSNTSGYVNTAIGVKALRGNINGYYNTACGTSALFSNSSGNRNTAIGAYALYSNLISNNNTAIGYETLNKNNGGHENVAVGTQALYKNINGNENCANGYKALYSNIFGWANIANGFEALTQNTTGSTNSAHGYRALYSNTTGSYNTAIGHMALYSTSSSGNTALGYGALQTGSQGGYNTAIGYNTGTNYSKLTNTTTIGNEAKVTASNQVRIGNINVTSIGGFEPWSNLSDGRYKSNIDEDVVGIDFIMGLRPITYNLDVEQLESKLGEGIRKDEDGNRIQSELSFEIVEARQKKASKRNTGFIAQEVEELANNLGFNFSGIEVPQNEHSMYRLRYAEFVVPLVKAMQEQQELIADLQNQIDELKRVVAK